MIYLNFILVGFLITGLEFSCATRNDRNKQRLLIKNTIFVNLLALCLLNFLLQKENLLLNETYTIGYSIKYVFFAIIIGFCYLFMKYVINHSTHLKICQINLTKKELSGLLISSILFILGFIPLIFGQAIPFLTTATTDSQILIYLVGVAIFLSYLWAPIQVVTNYRTVLSNQNLRRNGELFALILFVLSFLYTFFIH